ncbi:MAG: hypothetical protein IJF32_13730, partial [Oscillospiraceae bacterium]|nr:hypothetical protein [Oscillospiraceae bacterium]
MEKTLPLYLGPSVIGSVVCREEDSRIVLTAKTYASLHGICRAYVRGNGGRLLIGVLSPDETFFSAEKSVTKTSLYAEGLSFDGITYAYAVTSSKKHKRDITDWKKIDVLSDALCHDSAISALAKSTDALCDSSFSPTRLAVPLLTGRP